MNGLIRKMKGKSMIVDGRSEAGLGLDWAGVGMRYTFSKVTTAVELFFLGLYI